MKKFAGFLFSIACSLSSQAAIMVETEVPFAGPEGIKYERVVSEDPFALTRAGAVSSPFEGYGIREGVVTANVSYGAIKISAFSSSGVGLATGAVGATVTDNIRIDSVGLEGQEGVAKIFLATDWIFRVGASMPGTVSFGQIQAAVLLDLAGTDFVANRYAVCHPEQDCTLSSREYFQEDPARGTRLPSGISALIPFIYGKETVLTMVFLALAQSGGQYGEPQVEAFADASHSLYWGGMSDVFDSAGNSVSFEVTSASGTNYRDSFAPAAEVPEPGTALLTLFGLALFSLSGRVRRRH